MTGRTNRFDSPADSGLTSGTPMVCHSTPRRIFRHGTLLVAMLLAAVACRPADAFPPHPKHQKRTTRATVVALEEQWRQAQLNGDAAAMDRLLSDDFVGITAFGQVTTKMQQLDRIRERTLAITQLDLSDIKVKLIGPIVAVVTSRAQVKGTNDGLPMSGEFRYTRVYQRLPSGVWKITSFEATRIPTDGGRPSHAEPDVPPTPHP
jgi:ketosteroid isomerase-like protein